MWRTRVRYCCMIDSSAAAPRSAAYNPRSMRFERGVLRIGGLSAAALAKRYGTPLFAYDAAILRRQIERLRQAFASLPFRPFYAMKANGSLAILRLVHANGFG